MPIHHRHTVRCTKDVERPVLVMSLDRTIVHTTRIRTTNASFPVGSSRQKVYVQVRPGAHKFMKIVSMLCDVYFFTETSESFAEQVILQVAPFISRDHCLFSDSCVRLNGYTMKDLSLISAESEKIILIDDCLGSGMMQPYNCVGITPWDGDNADNVLLDELEPIVSACAHCQCFTRAVRNAVTNSGSMSLSLFQQR